MRGRRCGFVADALCSCAHLEMEREVGALEGEGELAGLEIGNLLEHLVLKKKLFNDAF